MQPDEWWLVGWLARSFLSGSHSGLLLPCLERSPSAFARWFAATNDWLLRSPRLAHLSLCLSLSTRTSTRRRPRLRQHTASQRQPFQRIRHGQRWTRHTFHEPIRSATRSTNTPSTIALRRQRRRRLHSMEACRGRASGMRIATTSRLGAE